MNEFHLTGPLSDYEESIFVIVKFEISQAHVVLRFKIDFGAESYKYINQIPLWFSLEIMNAIPVLVDPIVFV